MIYEGFMKNFFLADTSELLAVLPISASWAQKRFIPTLQTSCTSNSWEMFFSPIRANSWVLASFSPPEPKNVWFLLSRHDIRRVHEKLFSRRYERAVGCFTHFGLLSPKTFDSYFIDIMYVEFMRKFFQADSSEPMGVRPISASWAQKRLIPTLQTSCTSNSWEIFFSPIRANWCVLDSFSPPEPKNVWFLLSRHDIRRVDEKLFSGRYERAVGCFTHFGLLSPKTFHSYFIDIMYVEFMKKIFLADSSELMGVRLISPSWAQKGMNPNF